MRRRVILAQSLLGEPDVLVLDEPTVGLDPEQRLRFRQIVSEHAEHRCVVLSTHMTEDVEALCDRVIVMDLGSISFDGTTADLAGIAAGRVWLDDRPDPRATVSWRTGDGRHRNVGTPPPSRTTGADRAGRISPADRRDAGGGGVSTVTLQLARVEAARLARNPLVWLSIVPIAFWVRLNARRARPKARCSS